MTYTVQQREAATGAWRRAGRTSASKSEARALDLCRAYAEADLTGTYRVIEGDPFGAFTVVAMRAPAVCDDRSLRRAAR